MPRSGLAGLYGSSVFNSLMNVHTDFHCGRISLQAHQQCTGSPISTFSPAFIISRRRRLTISTGAIGDVALTGVSLVVSDVEHMFTHRLAICVSALHLHSFFSFCLFRAL